MSCQLHHFADKHTGYFFYTKKANKEEHGIGIKIIDSLIEKYHGKRETDTDEETNLFRCCVSLTIQENEAGRMVSDE